MEEKEIEINARTWNKWRKEYAGPAFSRANLRTYEKRPHFVSKKKRRKNIYMYRGKQSHLIHLLFAIEIKPGEINTYIRLYTIVGISLYLSHCSLLPQQRMRVDSCLIFTTSYD